MFFGWIKKQGLKMLRVNFPDILGMFPAMNFPRILETTIFTGNPETLRLRHV